MHLPSATLQQHSMHGPVSSTPQASVKSADQATDDSKQDVHPKVDKVSSDGEQQRSPDSVTPLAPHDTAKEFFFPKSD